MDYATITGSPEFIKAAIDYTFMGNQPAGTRAAAVGTPGGSGAVRSMIYNYLDNGEAARLDVGIRGGVVGYWHLYTGEEAADGE